ncbi:MAG TPA: hypothetical protein VFA55_08940, partial [Candidatus Kapabacteria bacterium]|nr:hypothetical protein [Candidatus Kapabacteria bacterium]
NDVLSAGPIQTSAIAPGANNTFLTTDKNGVAGFNALDVDGVTLKGDGSSAPLAVNLAHANNWDANSTMFGDSTSNQQVIINGVADATNNDDPTAGTWDLSVTGDINASGIIRSGVGLSGNGITIDAGNSQIFSSQALTITTSNINPASLTLSPSGSIIFRSGNAVESFRNMDMNGNSISNIYRLDGGGLGIIIGDGEPIAITNLGTGVVKVLGDVLSSGQVDLASDVTNILPPQNGGTGLDGSAAANGSLLIGNGTGYTLANLTAGNNVSITNSAGGITIAASSRTAVSAAYTATASDYILGVTAGGVTINLPSAASVTAGKMYIIKDESGSAATSNITITPSGTETIDGAGGNATISTNYGVLKIYSDGTNWFTF